MKNYVRQFTAITVHAHGSSLADALERLGTLTKRKRYEGMIPMTVWISEPSDECDDDPDDVFCCASAVFAEPSSGHMIEG